MKNNTTNLSNRESKGLHDPSRAEGWFNGRRMIVANFFFAILLCLFIIVEVDTVIDSIDRNGVPLVVIALGQKTGHSRDGSKPEFTYATFAENDIHQTPMDTDISGNLLTNDSDPTMDIQWIQSLTAFDVRGNPGPVQLDGCHTDIYDQNGRMAGIISISRNGLYQFDPIPSFSGKIMLFYSVEDVSGAFDDATFSIEVIPPNHLATNEQPIAHNDTNVTEMDTDVAGQVITSNDYDLENEELTISTVLADINGDGFAGEEIAVGSEATIYGKNPIGNSEIAGAIILYSDGSYFFDPTAVFFGKIHLVYEVTDESGGQGQALLVISVLTDTGNQSFANDDVRIGNAGDPQSGNIINNDFDPESDLQLVISATDLNGIIIKIDGTTENLLCSGGNVILDADGTFVYKPAMNFAGTEVITYITCDDVRPQMACDTATLYLTTLPVKTLVATDDDKYRKYFIDRDIGLLY